MSYSDSDGNGTIAQSEIKEENNYYPFGLKMKGFNANVNDRHHKYMFWGKEQQDELGLKAISHKLCEFMRYCRNFKLKTINQVDLIINFVYYLKLK